MERIKQDTSGAAKPDVWGGMLLGLDIEEVDGYGKTMNITFRGCSMAVAGVWIFLGVILQGYILYRQCGVKASGCVVFQEMKFH